MRFLFSVFALLFAATVSAVEAPAPGNEAPQRGMCRDEIKKVCGDVKPGDGKLKQCVETNRDKLSPACRERMDHMHDRAEAALKACQADTQKFCAGVELGGGRLHQCLVKNEAALSPDCRATLQHKQRPRPAKDAS